MFFANEINTRHNHPLAHWLFLMLIIWSVFSHAAELTVEANIEPFVSVVPHQSVVDIGSVSLGGVHASLPFAIQANTTRIDVKVLVTHLYKEASPGLGIFIPIDRDVGVDLVIAEAIPINGANSNATFITTKDLNKPEGVYAGRETETVTLESTQQNSSFQQDLRLEMRWLQEESIMPSGIYRGYVVLYVIGL